VKTFNRTVHLNDILIKRKQSLHNCTHVQLVGNSSRNEYSKTRSTVIKPPSVTGKNLGTVVKKICEYHAGVEIRQTGISRQSGSSTYTVQFSILTENNLLLEYKTHPPRPYMKKRCLMKTFWVHVGLFNGF
jgi:hypothetical protein